LASGGGVDRTGQETRQFENLDQLRPSKRKKIKDYKG